MTLRPRSLASARPPHVGVPRRVLGSTLALALALALGGCGDDSSGPPPPRRPPPPPPGAPGAGPMGMGAQLETYPKVPDALRRELRKENFVPDPTGDVNRDPFRSYVFDAVRPTKGSELEARVDECEKRMVAPQHGLRDLRLIGVVLRGTRSYAMLVDGKGAGHIVRRNDCLSKERVRIKDIGTSSIILELRADAPPGSVAPPPKLEEWKLHPQELQPGASP